MCSERSGKIMSDEFDNRFTEAYLDLARGCEISVTPLPASPFDNKQAEAIFDRLRKIAEASGATETTETNGVSEADEASEKFVDNKDKGVNND
jgi:hypothetical protein